MLYLAGLYRPSPFLSGLHEFVIMTRAANDSMAPIHDRMPVVLREEHIDEYLHDTASAKKLLCETPPMVVKRLVS
jgi:putative SOS response-associated peptidase YedK